MALTAASASLDAGQATANFSGTADNTGLQLGQNFAALTINHHHNYPGSDANAERRTSKPNPFLSVPFSRDEDFVDRGDVLGTLHERLRHGVARVALVGLGGVGKSQLAIEFAYQVRQSDPDTFVFWVHASTRARFEGDYRHIGEKLGVRGLDNPKEDPLSLVKEWLEDEANGRWVIIVDNADDDTLFRTNAADAEADRGSRTVPSLENCLPKSGRGCILFTSRSEDAAFRLTGNYNNIIEIGPMIERESVALFRKKARKEHEEYMISQLVNVLDNLPLAITQAVSYINRLGSRGSIARYLELFNKSNESKDSLLTKDGGDIRRDDSASHSIILTWQISFDQILEKRPSAAGLLSLMSFFDRQGIPEFALSKYMEYVDEEVGNDPAEAFEEDIAMLRSYCLVKTGDSEQVFEMHRLIQIATRKWLSIFGDLDSWSRKFWRNFSRVFPSGNFENWARCEALLPHAAIYASSEPQDDSVALDWSEVLTNASWYVWRKGRYELSESLARKALSTRTRILGEDAPNSLHSSKILALSLLEAGKYAEAERMSRRAMEGFKELYGSDNIETLTSTINVGLALAEQGKYDEAEQISREALKGCERTLGEDHPDTLICLNNLATVLQDQRKFNDAEDMHRRALERGERVFGKDHPDTLGSLNNLAATLSDLRKYHEAELIYVQAVEIRERVLGNYHPHTLRSVRGLALALGKQGKYQEAEQVNQRALDLSEKTLGKDHLATLKTLYNHAFILTEQDKFARALVMYDEVLINFEEKYGYDNPITVECRKNYQDCRSRANRGSPTSPRALYDHQEERNEVMSGSDEATLSRTMEPPSVMIDSTIKEVPADPPQRRASDRNLEAPQSSHTKSSSAIRTGHTPRSAPSNLGSQNTIQSSAVSQYMKSCQRKHTLFERMSDKFTRRQKR